MNETLEYRGITYVLPHNDDGAWRWMVTYSKLAKKNAIPVDAPRPVYASRAEAMAAAEQAIDAMFLKKKRLGVVA